MLRTKEHKIHFKQLILLPILILFTVSIVSGCAEKVCSNYECATLPYWYYLRWILSGIFAILVPIYILGCFGSYNEKDKWIYFFLALIFLELGVFSYFGTNSISFFWDLDQSLESIHFEYDIEKGKYNLENQIREAETVLKSSQKHLSEELQPLYNKYENEYEDYYRTLLKDLPRIGINDHERLLRNCERYIQSCNLLQRTAILKHSLEWLDSKISKVNYRISRLDQNLWLLQKKSELGEIASREEQDKVNELIVSTKYVLEEQITPAEDQDISKLEKKIFEKIINSTY